MLAPIPVRARSVAVPHDAATIGATFAAVAGRRESVFQCDNCITPPERLGSSRAQRATVNSIEAA
jgi:hypothetical protein